MNEIKLEPNFKQCSIRETRTRETKFLWRTKIEESGKILKLRKKIFNNRSNYKIKYKQIQ